MADGQALLEDPVADSLHSVHSSPHDKKKREIARIRKSITITAPDDTYNLAYYIMYLQGLGCLLPWNAFITVIAYFSSKLEGSRFKTNFLPYFTTGFQLVNIVMLVFASNAITKLSTRWRIVAPYCLNFIIFSGILVMVPLNITGDKFFYITFALVLGSAWTQAFYQGGLFGLAGMLPFQYTQALMAGQGLGGVLVAVLNLVTTVAVKDDPEKAALIFFSIAVAVLFLSFLTFFVWLRLPIVKHYRKPREKVKSHADSKEDHGSFFSILKKVWPLASSVCFVFTVTLAIFPSLAVKIESTNHSYYGTTLFVPIFCFIGFNLGDLIGRTLAARVHWPSSKSPRTMQIVSFARVIFVPIFMMCNVHTELTNSNSLPRVFMTDAVPYIMMLLLGITNGHFGSLCMMYAPTYVEPEHEEKAGFVMLVFMILGIGFGSFLSFILLAILCECNSFVGSVSNSTTNDTFAHF